MKSVVTASSLSNHLSANSLLSLSHQNNTNCDFTIQSNRYEQQSLYSITSVLTVIKQDLVNCAYYSVPKAIYWPSRSHKTITRNCLVAYLHDNRMSDHNNSCLVKCQASSLNNSGDFFQVGMDCCPTSYATSKS